MKQYGQIMNNVESLPIAKARSKLWTPEILANYLGVPVGWVYKRTRKNGPEMIPHIKLGKYVRFNPDSKPFQEWLLKHHIEDETLSFDEVTMPVIGN